MDLPTLSPDHIIPNHPFNFFAFGKKVVDGKIHGGIIRDPQKSIVETRNGTNFVETPIL